MNTILGLRFYDEKYLKNGVENVVNYVLFYISTDDPNVIGQKCGCVKVRRQLIDSQFLVDPSILIGLNVDLVYSFGANPYITRVIIHK